jgi:RND family efflux transporter MFP subunit
MRFLRSILRVLVTLAAVGIAAVLVMALWRSYMVSPWTRDGRVQAQVVNVAPEVAGTVVQVSVGDNQFVHRGDTLFQIDPIRFRLAMEQAQAAAESARNQLSLAQSESRRQQQLRIYASEEAREKAENAVQVASASLDQAQAALEVAKLNLARSKVVAPVNGFVTHLRLQAGSYVSAGAAQIAIVDSDSFWIEGYFEETKLAQVKPGEPARIRLMGYDTPFAGRVEGIGRGISDANDVSNNRGLPSVNPVFTWVRLAQRIPVRISIGELPPEVTLVVGMTASIAVGAESEKPAGLGARLLDWVRDQL